MLIGIIRVSVFPLSIRIGLAVKIGQVGTDFLCEAEVRGTVVELHD